MVLDVYEFRTLTGMSWEHIIFSREVYLLKTQGVYDIKDRRISTLFQVRIHLNTVSLGTIPS